MTFDHVFLMIDAMDECTKDQRHIYLEYIKSLLELPSGKLKIFVTSRPEPDIKCAFTSGSFPFIQIEATKVAKDIISYVGHMLHSRTHPYCDLKNDRELLEDVEHALVSKSNGMYVLEIRDHH